MRNTLLAALLVVLVASCGGGELSLTEYAEQIEGLTTTVYGTLDSVTAQMTEDIPTVQQVQVAYRQAADAFRGLSDGLRELEPPEEMAELHLAAIDLATRLTEAGEAFAQKAATVESQVELMPLFASPEAEAVLAAEEEIVAFCLERQAEFDATAEREGLADTPWIPRGMKEVVLVAFGCGE